MKNLAKIYDYPESQDDRIVEMQLLYVGKAFNRN